MQWLLDLTIVAGTLGLLLSIPMQDCFFSATSVGATAGMFAVTSFVHSDLHRGISHDDLVEGLGAFGEIRNNLWDGCLPRGLAVIVSLRTYNGWLLSRDCCFVGLKVITEKMASVCCNTVYRFCLPMVLHYEKELEPFINNDQLSIEYVYYPLHPKRG